MLKRAERAPLPDWFPPQLATLVPEPPAGPDWLHELKLDGYRLLARIDRGDVRLFTRRGNDWTTSFPRIANACAELGHTSAMVDGEAVILDREGRSNFQALQGSFGRERPDLFLVLFDLLHLDGWDLRRSPLLERKEALREWVERARSPVLRYSSHVVGRGDEVLREACRMGAEGIVCKRVTSEYRSVRTRDWLKVKCLMRQELVIVGFTDPGGARRGIGALLVGAYDSSGALVFCGKVGTGYTAETLLKLRHLLEPIERATPPVKDPPKKARIHGAHWVEPRYVAEVSFTEWTEEGLIRHPSFQGLRMDKPPEEVTKETFTDKTR